MKGEAGGATIFIYNASGQLVADYSDLPPSETSGTSYVTADHLGSTRVVTDTGGTAKKCYDYLPFGEQIPSSIGGRSSLSCYAAADTLRQKFTGKERDAESGLDYFEARYYGSNMGRFLSSDPDNEGAIYKDPQTWNAYSYVRNNPINATDPHGRGVSVCVEDSDTTKCWNMSDEEYKTLQEAQNRQQGINMPDGKFPSGAITCGGKVCGSAQYFEPPVESHD